MMKPIGGYFSLELKGGKSYHPNALALNTGRNCLELILRIRGYRKVFIPYYTCEVILEPFQKLNVEYEFYHINRLLELDEEIALKKDEALLYTNYFGLKQNYLEYLSRLYGKQLIIDNTQAFYARPILGIDTFYTCRKFFGVPDGAYIYTDAQIYFELENDISYDRMSFLLKRLDLGAEAGYPDFREQSERLVGQTIKHMSKLTEYMMKGISYQAIAKKRRENYLYLNESLASTNHLKLSFDVDTVPMVYPYLADNDALKQRLIANKVYVATYWPNVFGWCNSEDWEFKLAKNTLFLPIDQRYGNKEMKQIIDIIKH